MYACTAKNPIFTNYILYIHILLITFTKNINRYDISLSSHLIIKNFSFNNNELLECSLNCTKKRNTFSNKEYPL